jgi:CRISPR-associated exonuclease Cas4
LREWRSSRGCDVYAEDDLLPLSALQHLVFCERQCALIHIEQQWRDNWLTLEGSHSHSRVHEQAQRRELRGDILITRGLPLRSLRLGLSGRADVVEFHRVPGRQEHLHRTGDVSHEVAVAGLPGFWRPFPVEYKRGKPKTDSCDEVQLCAQALCLEEMLHVSVSAGALFYGRIQRRHDVAFGADLRARTEKACGRLRELLDGGIAPRVSREPKCTSCSLLEICQPAATAPGRSAARYLARAVARSRAGDGIDP